MFTEFKKFIMRGNVMDLAVAVILGAAFGKIVSSLVADIFTPVLSLALGKIDFANMFIALNGQHYDTLADAKKAAAATINYGLFLNAVIEFLIVAFVVFIIVKQVNRFVKPAAAPVTTKPCAECCTAIPLAAKRCPACTSVVAAA
jgi:large conductance mechanosensitive channel